MNQINEKDQIYLAEDLSILSPTIKVNDVFTVDAIHNHQYVYLTHIKTGMSQVIKYEMLNSFKLVTYKEKYVELGD